MHRRIITAIAALAALASTYAIPASSAVRLGLEGGLNQSGLTFRLDGSSSGHELELRPAWSAGLTAEIPLEARLSLNTGLRYVEYGDRWDITFTDGLGSMRFVTHQVWRYVAVPAIVRVRPFAGRGFFLGGGPEVGYLLVVRQTTNVTSTGGLAGTSARASARPGHVAAPLANIFEDVGTFDHPTKAYERWNLSIGGAIGYEFALGRHAAEAQLRYTHGLMDIAKFTYVCREVRGVEALLGARW